MSIDALLLLFAAAILRLLFVMPVRSVWFDAVVLYLFDVIRLFGLTS